MARAYASRLKFVVEKHEDGDAACPPGGDGGIVGEGDTFDDALADAKSAVDACVEAFGAEGLFARGVEPNHPGIKSSTIQRGCREAGIDRAKFMDAFEQRR